MAEQNLRDKLSESLGIRCVFPCNIAINRDIGNSGRCMLEWISEEKVTIPFDISLEDVIAKCRQYKNISVGNTKVTIQEVLEYLVSEFYSHIPKLCNEPGKTMLPAAIRLMKRTPSNSLHPGIAALHYLVERDSDCILLHDYSKHTMLSLSRFHAKTTLSSPTLGRKGGKGSKDLRLRFIIFQLLQVISFIHSQGLVLDDLKPGHIMLDDSMWLSMPISIANRSCLAAAIKVASKLNPSLSVSESDVESLRKKFYNNDSREHFENENMGVPRPVDYGEPITARWISGKVTNFEYLMAVNYAAGRSMADPLYHPILPWVTDFTVQYNPFARTGKLLEGMRDLTKTKFRLSKGDAQLETTYKHSDPPHHIPESLSELTYYIYMARRTPLQVLRRVVRDVFVPEHYPHSIARMYDWTPDECIPEFYTDPSVFESLHHNLNLPDLELPSFAPTPIEFIAYHRKVLESDDVSQWLHTWLDLTFGHCLDGQAAIDNMNVPLKNTLSVTERLGDSPNLDKHPGFVKLFSHPHPKKVLKSQHLDHNELHKEIVESNSLKVLTRIGESKMSYSEMSQHAKLSSCSDADNIWTPLIASKDSLLERDLHSFVDLDVKITSKARRRFETKDMEIDSAKNGGMNSMSQGSMNSMSSVATAGSTSANVSSLSTSNIAPAVQGSVMKSKYSLSKAHDGLSSWSKLRFADDIDISFDVRSKKAMDSLSNSEQAFEFSMEFGSYLEPCYKLPEEFQGNSNRNDSHSKHHSNTAKQKIWDAEIQEALDNLQSDPFIVNLKQQRQEASEPIKALIRDLQADDMFAIGCIIAEVYIGKPVMSISDAINFRNNRNDIMNRIYRETNQMPLCIRRLISCLMQPDAVCRPTPQEILQACTIGDIDTYSRKEYGCLRSGGMESGFVDFNDTFGLGIKRSKNGSMDNIVSAVSIFDWSWSNSKFLQRLSASNQDIWTVEPNPRLDLLGDYCGSLFPPYFKSMYTLIGKMKLCRQGLDRFRVVVNSLNELLSVPLEGLGLAMPHILACISDPTPFRTNVIRDRSVQNADRRVTPKKSMDTSTTNTVETKHFVYNENFSPDTVEEIYSTYENGEDLICHYPAVIDVLGNRLGVDITDKIVVPRVLEFLNKLNSPELLQKLLQSHIWHIVIIRAGVKSFLRNFLPLLLTYLSSGTLQNISKGAVFQDNGVSPLWATMGIPDKSEWLHLCTEDELEIIQQSAVLAISSLVDPGGLGPGLTARYVIPTLMCLVGVPHISAASFHITLQDKDTAEFDSLVELVKQNKLDPEELENYIFAKVNRNNREMYTVRVLVGLCFQLGELVTSELVLSKIFDEILPELETQFINNPSPSIVVAFMEIIMLLNGIFPSLSTDIVVKYYLQSHRSKSSSLPKLLNSIPLMIGQSVVDDLSEGKGLSDLETYLEGSRKNSLFLELCRLIVSTSMFTGAAACVDYVLPSIDKFFSSFIDMFSHLPVESRTMARGFELGAELFISLSQLTGELFYTTVPSLNPRLEMWLVSVGSGLPRKSPPLPPNILPEIVVDNTQQEGQKKKGFMQWISGKSKKFLSSSSTQASTNMQSRSASVAYLESQYHMLAASMESIQESQKTEESSSPSNSELNELSPVAAALQAHARKTPHSVMKTPFAANGNMVRSPDGMELKSIPHSNVKVGTNASVNVNRLDASDTPYQVQSSLGHMVESPQSPDIIGSAQSSASTPTIDKSGPLDLDSDLAAAATSVEMIVDEQVTAVENDNDHGNENENENEAAVEVFVDSDDEVPRSVSNNKSSAATNNTTSVAVDSRSSESSQGPSTDASSTSQLPSIPSTLTKKTRFNASTAPSTALRKPRISRIETKITSGVPCPAHFMRHLLAGNEINSASNAAANSEVGGNVSSSMGYSSGHSSHSSSNNTNATSGVREHSATTRRPSGGQQQLSRDIGSSSQQLQSGYSSALSHSAKKQSRVSMLSSSKNKNDYEEEEEEDARELHFHELTWLLGGNGKWNAEKDRYTNHGAAGATNTGSNSNGTANGNVNTNAGNGSSSSGYTTSKAKNANIPSAQVSMTAPRISVDIATETSSLFALNMATQTQWRIEDNTSTNHNVNLSISSLVVNPTESLLLSCSRSGIKLWSLNSHPVRAVATYNQSNSVPFSASFLRSGTQIASCDGAVNIWDVETKRTLAYISSSNYKGPFASMVTLSSRFGVTPSIGPYGDDQLLLSSVDTISHFDFRVQSSTNATKCISEWILPALPPVSSSFTSSSDDSNKLTCAVSHEHYVLAGTHGGGLHVVDRRMGRVFYSWQGHESPILKIVPIDDKHFMSLSEKAAYIWSCVSHDEPRKVLTVKNMPDTSSSVLYANTIIVNTFDQPTAALNSGFYFSNLSHQDHLPTNPLHVMYCISGHKMYAGRIPSVSDESGNRINLASTVRETQDLDELRLAQTYFVDRNRVKLPRQKLQVTSAALLPLRRLLLLGTEDGLVRVVS